MLDRISSSVSLLLQKSPHLAQPPLQLETGVAAVSAVTGYPYRPTDRLLEVGGGGELEVARPRRTLGRAHASNPTTMWHSERNARLSAVRAAGLRLCPCLLYTSDA